MNSRRNHQNPTFLILTLFLILSGVACEENSTLEQDAVPEQDAVIGPPLVNDYFPLPLVGDTLVWDYSGGWVFSGASTEYYSGTKTWRITGQHTKGGGRVLDVIQTFSGFRYAFPVPRDTVWYMAHSVAGQITEDSLDMITIAFVDSTGPARTPTFSFPRYLQDHGPNTTYAVGQAVGVRFTLKLQKNVGLIDVNYAVGGGHTSFLCRLTRR